MQRNGGLVCGGGIAGEHFTMMGRGYGDLCNLWV